MDHQLRCDWADDVLGQCEDERGHVGPHMVTGRENPSVRFFREQPQTYADGYRAGRIAALRECSNECRDQSCSVHGDGREPCAACRLLAEVESGEDAGEVGDDR